MGKRPLGPFEPMEGSPYTIRPAGFFTGGGHGHPFKDRYGNHWYVASLIIGAFDSEQTYYVVVQPFSEAGPGQRSDVLRVCPTVLPSGDTEQ